MRFRFLPMAPMAVALLATTSALHADATRLREIDVTLLPAEGRVEVRDQIEVRGAVAFQLNQGQRRPRAEIDGEAVDLVRRGGAWELAEEVPRGTILTLDYAFEVAREPDPDGPFLGPEGGFLPAWSGWLPSYPNGPVGFDLEVEIALPHRAVATGNLVEESERVGAYHARFRLPHAAEPPSIFSGPYIVDEREEDGVRYRTYFTQATQDLAVLYLERSSHHVERFAEQIGDYPYAGFSVVAAPVPVGLGFAGLTYVSERILPLPFMQGRSLAHEVLHSWFGNAVPVDYESGNWAEGLTTYLADYGILDDPADRRAMRLGWLRDYNALPQERDIVLLKFVAKGHDADQIVGYDKVAFVFHMLRRRLGDAAFAAGLRRFYDRHRFDRAGWRDLQASFEDVSGQDLARFFTQWLERPGAPSLFIEDVQVAELEDDYEVRLTLGQEAPFYDLRVPVELHTTADIEQRMVPIDSARAASSFRTAARPLRLAVDPDLDVFRRLAAGEAPPILRDVLLDPSTRAVVLADDQRGRDAARDLAEALLGEPVEAFGTVSGARYDRPLLLVGVGETVDRALSGLGLQPPREVLGPASAAVWTTARVDAPPVLVVRADDAQALAALARPLPHYRRDSWLRFDGASMIDRGIWPPGESALAVDLE